jgi:hypothetical protein
MNNSNIELIDNNKMNDSNIELYNELIELDINKKDVYELLINVLNRINILTCDEIHCFIDKILKLITLKYNEDYILIYISILILSNKYNYKYDNCCNIIKNHIFEIDFNNYTSYNYYNDKTDTLINKITYIYYLFVNIYDDLDIDEFILISQKIYKYDIYNRRICYIKYDENQYQYNFLNFDNICIKLFNDIQVKDKIEQLQFRYKINNYPQQLDKLRLITIMQMTVNDINNMDDKYKDKIILLCKKYGIDLNIMLEKYKTDYIFGFNLFNDKYNFNYNKIEDLIYLLQEC